MYLSATNYFLSGHNPYLAITPQVYPPAFLYFMTLFAFIPIEYARVIYTSLSLVAFFLSLHLLLKRFSLKIQVLISFIVFQLFPVKFALAQGQINFFVLLGFVLIYRFMIQKKDLLASLTLAIITIAKLNPILLLFYFLVLKKYRLIIYCLVTLLFLNLAIDLSTSHNLLLSFFQGTFFRTTNPPLDYYNQSLPALLSRLNLSSISNSVGVFFLSISTISLIKNYSQTKKFFTLFLLTILLISPITWQHYLFWSIPAFFYLFLDSQKPPLIFIFLALLLININLKNPLPFGNVQLIYSHATIGLFLLYILVLKSKPKFS